MLTRVLVWGIPELLCGIITSVCSREIDLEVIRPMDEGMSLVDAVKATLPDVIVTDQGDNATAAACDQVLWTYPHLRVIGLQKDGREAYLYRLTLEQMALGELSPEKLVVAIRRGDGWMPGNSAVKC
ncbi:MAG: hypothetical protein U1F76_29315 [Candidatus Competibacteraceae bacterium]